MSVGPVKANLSKKMSFFKIDIECIMYVCYTRKLSIIFRALHFGPMSCCCYEKIFRVIGRQRISVWHFKNVIVYRFMLFFGTCCTFRVSLLYSTNLSSKKNKEVGDFQSLPIESSKKKFQKKPNKCCCYSKTYILFTVPTTLFLGL